MTVSAAARLSTCTVKGQKGRIGVNRRGRVINADEPRFRKVREIRNTVESFNRRVKNNEAAAKRVHDFNKPPIFREDI